MKELSRTSFPRLKPFIQSFEEVPNIVYHRTTPEAWKNILKNGVLVGGGDYHSSNRAHVYFATRRLAPGDRNAVAGVRRQYPVEISVALRDAVRDGYVCFMTAAGTILRTQHLHQSYITTINDTLNDKVLHAATERELQFEPEAEDRPIAPRAAWHEYRENIDERTVYVAGSDNEPEEEQIVDNDPAVDSEYAWRGLSSAEPGHEQVHQLRGG